MSGNILKPSPRCNWLHLAKLFQFLLSFISALLIRLFSVCATRKWVPLIINTSNYLIYVTISTSKCNKSKTVSDESTLAETSQAILLVIYRVLSLILWSILSSLDGKLRIESPQIKCLYQFDLKHINVQLTLPNCTILTSLIVSVRYQNPKSRSII